MIPVLFDLRVADEGHLHDQIMWKNKWDFPGYMRERDIYIYMNDMALLLLGRVTQHGAGSGDF